MKPLPMILLGGSAAALLGFAGYSVWAGDEEPMAEASVDTTGDRSGSVAGDSVREKPRFIKPLMNLNGDEPKKGPRRGTGPTEAPPTAGKISNDEALQAFNTALSAMDEAMENGRPSRRRKAELYSQATNAFTALSVHLNGANPEERVVLEEAHFEMKQRMKAMKMKVPERPGVVLEAGGR